MTIDFHTHIFPDKIAEKTIKYLSEKGGIPPFSNGSVSGLIQKAKEASVDLCVTLPVLTNPDSFESVNKFADGINKSYPERIISFGAIHPRCENIDGKMLLLKNMGFKGVKIHPDYQGAYINDEGYVKILQSAKEYDLIVVTHSGIDVAYPEDVHCTVKLLKELLSKVEHSKFVLAHMGCGGMYDEVLEYLCGKDLYFDTAFVLRSIGTEKFSRILERHGDDRILFASDSPWSDISNDLHILRQYVDNDDSFEKIKYKNAKKLLDI